MPFLYFFLNKSWIWRTRGQVVNIFSYFHFNNASKEWFWPKIFLNFMQGFKSAILAKLKNCQNGTFEPVHEIQKIFWPKSFFWSIRKMAIWKFFCNVSQGLPNPGFIQEKVQKGDFLKKDSREFFFSCFRFLWISRRPETLNWERVVFLPYTNLYRKCVFAISQIPLWVLLVFLWFLEYLLHCRVKVHYYAYLHILCT